MKLLSELILPILLFLLSVTFSCSTVFDPYDASPIWVVIAIVLNSFMLVLTGIYAKLVIEEYYEITLKELKEKKDEN